MANKRARSLSPPSAQIFHSTPITHGRCTFIGAYSPNLPTKSLQSLPQFRTASHRVVAWRTPSKQKSLMPKSKVLYDTGHDDDGEKWAGQRLANVLDDTQTEGSVVIARWYGGEMIGPIRFTHIENCAREAIWKWKTRGQEQFNQKQQEEAATKKPKTDEDVRRKALIEELQQRDSNILALRRLLAEKKAKLEDEDVVPPTPQKMPDYGRLVLPVLERLDKARDKTTEFVLTQIDKIEAELKLVEELEGDLDGASRDENGDNGKGKEPMTPK